MSNIQRPQGPQKVTHYQFVETQQINKDKRQHEWEEIVEKKQQKATPIFIAALLHCLKTIIDIFAPLKARTLDKSQFTADLKALRSLFQNLEKEDQSQNNRFAQELSTTWLHLAQDCKEDNPIRRDFPAECVETELLMETIAAFSLSGTHTFGQYLNEHVGDNWFPFPFMEILFQLHKDATEAAVKQATLRRFTHTPPQSQLRLWITSITDLLERLKTA